VTVEEVRDDERVARFCDRSQVKRTGVRYHAFIMTKFPTELSVDRVELGNVEARAERETTERGHSRTFVTLLAGNVRALPDVTVHARPLTRPTDEVDAPEHAEIHLHHAGLPVPPSKEDLQRRAELWKKHIDCCVELAKMARPRDCDQPEAN